MHPPGPAQHSPCSLLRQTQTSRKEQRDLQQADTMASGKKGHSGTRALWGHSQGQPSARGKANDFPSMPPCPSLRPLLVAWLWCLVVKTLGKMLMSHIRVTGFESWFCS